MLAGCRGPIHRLAGGQRLWQNPDAPALEETGTVEPVRLHAMNEMREKVRLQINERSVLGGNFADLRITSHAHAIASGIHRSPIVM